MNLTKLDNGTVLTQSPQIQLTELPGFDGSRLLLTIAHRMLPNTTNINDLLLKSALLIFWGSYNQIHISEFHSKTKNKISPPGGLEPPTFRLTAERASQLRHGGGR